ncbi:hypothetical protein [Metallibacterium scheffleri]|uniref:GspE/PulE/PilB domain-containing protein n=1 Tax=Metallibacterium scheffleri TaxID=993689 RepID=UPI003CCDC08C
MRVGAISEDSLLEVLAAQLDLPLLGRDAPMPDEALLRDSAAQLQVSADWMLDQQVLIWQTEDSGWWCAARDPLAPSLGELLRAVLAGARCACAWCARRIWSARWRRCHACTHRCAWARAATMWRTCANWPRKRRWWSWSTTCWRRRWNSAPRICISSRRKTSSRCAFASTACCIRG